MKLIISIIQISFSILVLVFVLISVCQQVYALKEYVNDEYDIRFQYPDHWQIIDQDDKVVEIEDEIRIDLLFLRTEQKEAAYKPGDPAIGVQVYPNIDNLKQLSKQVIKEMIKENFYDVIDYKKKYIGNTEYLNITYHSTPKMDFYVC